MTSTIAVIYILRKVALPLSFMLIGSAMMQYRLLTKREEAKNADQN